MEIWQLDNGLKVVAEPMAHLRSVAVGLWVAAGTIYETERERGISHYIEHMLFKGTQRRSARDLAIEMDAIGGNVNAFTSKECTCYHARVVDDQLERALSMLTDMLLHAKLDPADMEREKGVVLEEISMTEDTPEDLVQDLLSEAYFGDHPLARPILGTAQSVAAFSQQDVMGYMRRRYRPEHTVLAVAGHFDRERLLELAHRYLGDWQRGGDTASEPASSARERRMVSKAKETEQTQLCIGLPGLCQQQEELLYTQLVLNNVIGGGMSSRLFQRIREEKGMAYSVYSYPATYLYDGVFMLYAATNPANSAQVAEMMLEQLDLLRREGISQEEFDAALEQMRGSYILGMESANARMSAIGRGHLLLGRARGEDEVMASIAAVTKSGVMDLAERLFVTDKLALSVVGNAASIDQVGGQLGF